MKLLFRKIRSFIIPVAITLTVVILFHSIFFLGYVPTESMEPTLKTGSLILGLRCCDDLQNGDVKMATNGPVVLPLTILRSIQLDMNLNLAQHKRKHTS